MKVSFTTLLLCLLFLACNKTQSPSLIEPTPYVPNHQIFIIEEESDSFKFVYTYDQMWRISSLTRSVDEVQGEKVSWLKSGNIVKKTSTINPYIYTYYLNKKGFADSITTIYPGYVYLTEKISYSNEGLPTNKKTTGTVLSNLYEEEFTYEFLNGNLIKQIQTFEDQIFTNTYTYYLDSSNFMAGTFEAMNFIPQSKNLLKKIVREDETFMEYSYSWISNNEISVQIIDEESNFSSNIYKLKKINE